MLQPFLSIRRESLFKFSLKLVWIVQLTHWYFKGREGAFVKTSQIIQFHTFWTDARGEYEAFRIEGGHGATGKIHKSLTIRRSVGRNKS